MGNAQCPIDEKIEVLQKEIKLLKQQVRACSH